MVGSGLGGMLTWRACHMRPMRATLTFTAPLELCWGVCEEETAQERVQDELPKGCGSCADLQDFPEEAQVFVEEGEAGAEAHHAAQHERMVRVVARIVACRPAPPQQLQRLLPANTPNPFIYPTYLHGARIIRMSFLHCWPCPSLRPPS